MKPFMVTIPPRFDSKITDGFRIFINFNKYISRDTKLYSKRSQ